MKTILFGKGPRLFQIADAFGGKRKPLTVVTDDEATFAMLAAKPVERLHAKSAEFEVPVKREDLVLVAEDVEEDLRMTLDHLRRAGVEGPIVVFTSLPLRQLVKHYPGVDFRNDNAIYRDEIQEVLDRAATTAKVEQIRALVPAGKRAVVLIWGNPDPDAIACAFALRELLAKPARDFVIAYMGEITRPENRAMVDVVNIPMVKFHPELLTPDTVTITVDAQPAFFTQPDLRFDVVIDHHPIQPMADVKFADLRPDVGAASTILTEYFLDSGTKMSRRVATALYYGLRTDTANLMRNVSDHDIRAYQVLREHMDENMIRSIELTQFPAENLDTYARAIAKRRMMGNVLFAYLGPQDNVDHAVIIADFFIKVSGIAWAIVGARSGDRLVLIFRADGFKTDAGALAEELFSEFGTAGGHRTMARAEIDLARADLSEDAAVEPWLLRKLSGKLKAIKSALRG